MTVSIIIFIIMIANIMIANIMIANIMIISQFALFFFLSQDLMLYTYNQIFIVYEQINFKQEYKVLFNHFYQIITIMV